MKSKIDGNQKAKVLWAYMFYLQHPREYLRAFYTGHIVPATYRWARKINQEKSR